MMRNLAFVTALGLLAGCSRLGIGDRPAPPPPDHTQRVGVDRQAPASSLAVERGQARHDADVEGKALDESRGQAIGSIVPPEAPAPKQVPSGTPPAQPSTQP
ncbi:MAG: hypothetical protein AB7O88_04920 [Reyranellaceae bacterium]